MNTTKQEEKKYNINVNTFLEVLQETLVYAENVKEYDYDEVKELKHISDLFTRFIKQKHSEYYKVEAKEISYDKLHKKLEDAYYKKDREIQTELTAVRDSEDAEIRKIKERHYEKRMKLNEEEQRLWKKFDSDSKKLRKAMEVKQWIQQNKKKRNTT